MDELSSYKNNYIFIEPKNDVLNELKKKFKVRLFNSIDEIDKNCWDSLAENIFQSYDFLRSIEKSGIEHSNLYYLLFYAEGVLIGSAVFSSFNISLDLLAGYSLQKFVRAIRSYYPSFFKVRFLFCGTPVSIGKNNISLKDKNYKKEFTSSLSRVMSVIARLTNSKIQCVKELTEDDMIKVSGLCDYDFLPANTMPYMNLELRWKDFGSYIRNMRYKYRRQIKEGLKKLGLEEPLIYTSVKSKTDRPYLLLTSASQVSPEKFYSLYMQVMEEQKNKLETLNLKFFENLFTNKYPDVETISLIYKDEVLGSALLVHIEDKLTFLLIGFDHRKNKIYDIYFNIVYGIITVAIKRKCRTLEMGQTSYYLKQRCGALSTDLYMYIKSDNKLVQLLLKLFRNRLFPKITLPQYNVFSTTGTLRN